MGTERTERWSIVIIVHACGVEMFSRSRFGSAVF
jgi:hypothetical protein